MKVPGLKIPDPEAGIVVPLKGYPVPMTYPQPMPPVGPASPGTLRDEKKKARP